MEEQLGKGYQQIMIGLIVFIAGAIWGGMQATNDMVAEDIYWKQDFNQIPWNNR